MSDIKNAVLIEGFVERITMAFDQSQPMHMLVSLFDRSEKVHVPVGYESPSQFRREYRRMFGAPRKHAAAMKADA